VRRADGAKIGREYRATLVSATLENPSYASRRICGRASRCRRGRASSPENSAVSMPGLRLRNRSASSAVAVRRGSITTSLAPRHPPVLPCMRRNRNRVAPCRVSSRRGTIRVGLIEILIQPRHRVGAERRGDGPATDDDMQRARNLVSTLAEPTEALHQLVGGRNSPR